MHAIDKACSPSRAIFCVGTSFNDDVVPNAIKRWAQTRQHQQRKLTVFVAFFDEVPLRKLEEIEQDVSKTLGDKEPHLQFYYTKGVNADNLLERLIEIGSEITKKNRGKGMAHIYVPLMPRNSLRARMFHYSGKLDKKGFISMPSDPVRMKIELIIHAVSSRGPFTLRDLVRSSAPFTKSSLKPATDRFMHAREVLSKLVKGKVLSYLHHESVGRRISTYPPSMRSLEEIERVELVRCPESRSVKEFSQRCLDTIGSEMYDASLWAPPSEFMRWLLLVEREACHAFVPHQGVPVLAMFESPRLIRSHRDLEAEMDDIKEHCRRIVDHGEAVECYVVTETGEHLFRPDLIEKKIEKELEKIDVEIRESKDNISVTLEGLLRPWISAFYKSKNQQQRLNLFLSVADPYSKQQLDWRFEEDDQIDVYPRSKVEESVDKLISLIRGPRISVQYVPSDRHVDHMWYFEAKKQEGERLDGRGLYYPSRYFERLYYGAALSSESDLRQLEAIRKQWLGVHAYPQAQVPVSWVLATTIIDYPAGAGPETLDEARVLVCVRDEGSNKDHRNIASIPTKRIPRLVYEDLSARAPWSVDRHEEKICDRDYLFDNASFVSSNGRTGEDVLRDAVFDLLARKFNLGDAIERQEISFGAKPAVVRVGFSPVLRSEDSGEYLAMINVLVRLDGGARVFERIKSTASYSHIEFIRVDDFLKALQNDRTVVLNGESFQYGGLCVCSTSLLLSLREGGLDHRLVAPGKAWKERKRANG